MEWQLDGPLENLYSVVMNLRISKFGLAHFLDGLSMLGPIPHATNC